MSSDGKLKQVLLSRSFVDEFTREFRVNRTLKERKGEELAGANEKERKHTKSVMRPNLTPNANPAIILNSANICTVTCPNILPPNLINTAPRGNNNTTATLITIPCAF